MKYNTINEGVGTRGETVYIVATIDGEAQIHNERFSTEAEAVTWCEASTTRYVETRQWPSLRAVGLARSWDKKLARAFKAKQHRQAA